MVLAIGQVWESLGAEYRVIGFPRARYVLVERCDRHYSDRSIWHENSILTTGMVLKGNEHGHKAFDSVGRKAEHSVRDL